LLDRVGRELELAGDLRVGEAGRDQREDLALAGGQALVGGAAGGALGGAAVLGDEPGGAGGARGGRRDPPGARDEQDARGRVRGPDAPGDVGAGLVAAEE